MTDFLLATYPQSMGMTDSTSVFSQRRDTLMSAAAVAQAAMPALSTSAWCWDITRQLPLSVKVAVHASPGVAVHASPGVINYPSSSKRYTIG